MPYPHDMTFFRMQRYQHSSKQKEVCPRCGKLRYLTIHHKLPKGDPERGNKESQIRVCRKCHDWLDKRDGTAR